LPDQKYTNQQKDSWIRSVDKLRKRKRISIKKAAEKIGCPESIYYWHKKFRHNEEYKTAAGVRSRKKRIAAEKEAKRIKAEPTPKSPLSNLPMYVLPSGNGSRVLAVALIGDPVEIGKAIAEIQKQV